MTQDATTEASGPKASGKKSDLRVRLASAVVMLLVAGSALALGGGLLIGFILLIGLGLIYEFRKLVLAFAQTPRQRLLWMLGGLVYIGLACDRLLLLPAAARWTVILAVIATDTGAYFAGRSFGGPKIAPAVSPSKTWSGLFGGMAGAALVLVGAQGFVGEPLPGGPLPLPLTVAAGALLAVVAQAGDFFESWMKRRARVKDSSALIPGHGGLFDRLDGLLAVSVAIELIMTFRDMMQ